MFINDSVAGFKQPAIKAYGNVLLGWKGSGTVQSFGRKSETELWVWSLVWPWLQCKSGQVTSSPCSSWLEPIGSNVTQIITERLLY